MSLISIKNLTFSYSGSYDLIFDNISLELDSDWKLGLVGRNGKGKTTLLKLLMKEFEFSGKIETVEKFAYFPFDVTDESDYTFSIVQSINSGAENWEIMRELSLLDVDDDVLYRPYATLSKGEQTKVQLAIFFARQTNFLLIDEPTNHLDIDGRIVLANYLKKKKSFIIISHDRVFLDNIIDHTMSINRKNIEVQKGNFTTYLENKERIDDAEADTNECLKKEIKRLKAAVMQSEDWSSKVEKTKFGGKQDSGLRPDRGAIGAKSAKMMKHAKGIERRAKNAIEDKSDLLKNVDSVASLKIGCMTISSERLISAKNLQVVYDGIAVNAPLNFEINTHDRVAIIGKNGSGKTSILNAILKSVKFLGEVYVKSNLIISYVNQDASKISGSLDDICSNFGVDKTKLLTILSKLGYDKVMFQKNASEFSEGQKKKLLISLSLAKDAHVFIWDEPLNYLDIISRKQIEELLLANKVTIIFVEHDAFFVDKIANKKIVLE